MSIIKKRWQEVLLISVFTAGMLIPITLLMSAVSPDQQELLMPGWVIFVLTAGSVFFGVLSTMLVMGFLETAWRGRTEPEDPARILIIGRKYFWRMFRTGLLLQLFAMVISQMVIVLIYSMVLGLDIQQQGPAWVGYVSLIVANAIIARPALLIPPLFIVTGASRVLEAFGMSKSFAIRGMVGLILLYVAAQVAAAGLLDGWRMLELTGIFKYAVLGIFGIAVGFVTFVPSIAAMKYIADRTEPPKTEPAESEA